ncbi:MAG: hypothetical protein ACJATV_000726 [Granulosicoccus sp.]|jgi:hypothetical protein
MINPLHNKTKENGSAPQFRIYFKAGEERRTPHL